MGQELCFEDKGDGGMLQERKKERNLRRKNGWLCDGENV